MPKQTNNIYKQQRKKTKHKAQRRPNSNCLVCGCGIRRKWPNPKGLGYGLRKANNLTRQSLLGLCPPFRVTQIVHPLVATKKNSVALSLVLRRHIRKIERGHWAGSTVKITGSSYVSRNRRGLHQRRTGHGRTGHGRSRRAQLVDLLLLQHDPCLQRVRNPFLGRTAPLHLPEIRRRLLPLIPKLTGRRENNAEPNKEKEKKKERRIKRN